MKRYLILILMAILVLTSAVLVACGQKSEAPASPTPEQMQPKPESPSSEDWEVLNRWLHGLYGLPPVYSTEELESAAFLVSGFWFEQADKEVKKLEQQDIPWSRTAPFCYFFNYYVLHDIQLRNASTPLEFMAADSVLGDSVKLLHDEAEELLRMKWLGEPLNIFPTEEEARKRFEELDKDWERLMNEAIEKGSSTKIYQNDQYGYSFGIPKTWTTTINEEEIGHTATFRPPNKQMEVTVKVSSELALNNAFSEAKNRGVDVKGLTPLELVIRYRSTEITELGAESKRINWNEQAVTTLIFTEGKDWKSWVKTHYVVDRGNFYIIEFKVLGYSDSEFEEYRNQVNEISKSFHIEGSTVINLPEGKTIFDF